MFKQQPGEVNYVATINQLVDVLKGLADAGVVTLFAPIAAPGALTAAAAAGTGLGEGTYRYRVTFVTGYRKGDGTLDVVGETEGSATAIVVTAGSNRAVQLTNIPVGPQGTIARRIYRTAVGGADGTQKLAITIDDNTTTSYVDAVADGSLGAAVPTVNTTGTVLILAGNPTAALAAVPKQYVDALVTSHLNDMAPHSATSAATADRLILRDANARAKVGAPAAGDDIARLDTVWTGIEESLIVETALPVANAEPEQVQTTMGPAIEFVDAATKSITWNRRWPFSSGACHMDLVVAADVANAGGFRLRVAWQVNGGAVTNVDVTVTPGSNTTLYTAELGQIVPAASLAAGAIVTITLSRLGADAADTHTGRLRLYHTRMRGV